MGVREWLPRRADLTAGWIRAPDLRLLLDFHGGSLCGVALGDPVERLAFLGPTDRSAGPEDDLEYLSLGLSVGYTAGNIDFYGLWWQDHLGAGYRRYAGAVLLGGRAVALGPVTPEHEVLEAFGPPYWRDQDDEETILFYEPRDASGRVTERQVELDDRGALRALLVLADPILAEEDSRRAYRVDRPWPPP